MYGGLTMQPISNFLRSETIQNTAYVPPEIMEGEYRGEDGYIHCVKCHGKRSTMGFTREVRCICKCQVEEKNRQLEAEKQEAKRRRIEKLIKMSLLGDRYKSVNFDSTEQGSDSFNIAFKRCKKYCEVADQVLERGIGIYLFGDKGTGKTRLTACMAIQLMQAGYTTLFTNFSEISKNIRSSFNGDNQTEQKIISHLADVDFLFIDDLGVERVTKGSQDLWLQEKIYDVINARYNNKAPIIFTSNFSLRELIENRGLDDRTIDRIMEMAEVMKIEGTSYRAKAKQNREKLF